MSRARLHALWASGRSTPLHLSRPVYSTGLVVRTTSRLSKAISLTGCALFRPASLRAYATASKSSSKRSSAKKPSSQDAPRKTKPSSKKKSTKKSDKKKPKRKPAKKATRKRVKKPVDDVTLKIRKVKELKQQALVADLPKLLPAQAYLVYVTEHAKGKAVSLLGPLMKDIAAGYRGLSSGEKATYENIATQNKEANKKIMASWISSHSPDEIRMANNARRSLNRLAKEPVPSGRKRALVGHSYKLLEDPRQLKRVDTPYIAFARERWASGDFRGVSPIEAMKSISMEYRNLSTSELQSLRDRYEQDRTRYIEEFNRTFTTKAGQRPKKTTS